MPNGKIKDKESVSEINEIPTRDRPTSASMRKKHVASKRNNDIEQTGF